MIRRLSKQTVYEITAPKSARDERGDLFSVRSPKPDVVADVDEDFGVAHRDEREFAEVGVGGEVLERVELHIRGWTVNPLKKKVRARGNGGR